MENSFILFILAVALVHIKASDPLQASFKDPKDRLVQLGAEVNLDVVVNRSPIFGLQNSVFIRRQRMENGVLKTDDLADTGKLLNGGEPDYYEVEVDTDQEFLTIHFKIKQVRDIDDATFICQAVSSEETANSSLKIIVLRNNDKLSMKFGDNDPISKSMDSPFQVDAGKYPVTCTSEGSNPATEDIHVFWSGDEMMTSGPEIEQMDTSLVKYKTTVETELDIDLKRSGQTIECQAKSEAGNQLSVKAPIKVNVYNPTVECTSASAFVGKRYPVLSCTVNETGHEIESYAYQSGKTGVLIKAGDQSGDFDEVIKTDLGDSKVKVDLKLHRVKDYHFSKYYLIITQKNGHISREAVVLSEVEGPKDSSNMLGTSLATFVLCVVYALWKTL